MLDPADREAVSGSLIGTLPGDLVETLLRLGSATDHPPGSTIYRENAAPMALLVVRGLLRVYMTSPEGRQVTVRYARAREVLGIAVLVGGPANVGVQTLTAARLFRIDSRTLTAAAQRDARVSWALAQELNRRLYDTLRQTAGRRETAPMEFTNTITINRRADVVFAYLAALKQLLESAP